MYSLLDNVLNKVVGALSKRDSRLTVQFVTDVAKLLEKVEKHDMVANKYKRE